MTIKKIRRGICLMAALFAVCASTIACAMTAYAKPAWPSDTGIQAEAGIVMDMDSGAVLMAQNSHTSYPPASITKLLTALIVIENADLAETVTFSDTAMNSVESDSGNKLSLVAGDSMSVEDCLYALLLASVNQAANALAEHVAGSIEAFVGMMNDKVAGLGLTESHFDNPSGLNGDTQYVSAHDMAVIAQAAFNNETLLRISSTLTYKLPPTANNPEGKTISHEHRLLYTTDTSSQYYYPEAVAGKTGYLIAAGNTLVTYAEKDGRRLVSVILKGKPRQYFIDGKELLIFGFDRFYNADIAENERNYVTGDTPIEVGGAAYPPSELMIEPGKAVTLPKDATFSDAEPRLSGLPEEHPRGAIACLEYYYDDRKIGSAFLAERDEYLLGQREEDGEIPETGSSPGISVEASEETQEEDGNKTVWNITINVRSVLMVTGIAAFAAAAVFFTVSFSRKRKQEAEERQRRIERRRRRLLEEGLGQDELDRLLEERRKKNKK